MSKTVVIVDDATFMRLMLKDFLNKLGYNIIGEADNGRCGVELYKQLSPDVVIMDITMPEMDGITAIQRIKEYDPNAKILVCSARGQVELVVEALGAGAEDFVVKPFQHYRLIQALDDILCKVTFFDNELLKQAVQKYPDKNQVLEQYEIDELIVACIEIRIGIPKEESRINAESKPVSFPRGEEIDVFDDSTVILNKILEAQLEIVILLKKLLKQVKH